MGEPLARPGADEKPVDRLIRVLPPQHVLMISCLVRRGHPVHRDRSQHAPHRSGGEAVMKVVNSLRNGRFLHLHGERLCGSVPSCVTLGRSTPTAANSRRFLAYLAAKRSARASVSGRLAVTR